MSYIQQTIKCKNCGKEMNVVLGTFGSGLPTKCPQCNDESLRYETISQGWNASPTTMIQKIEKINMHELSNTNRNEVIARKFNELIDAFNSLPHSTGEEINPNPQCKYCNIYLDEANEQKPCLVGRITHDFGSSFFVHTVSPSPRDEWEKSAQKYVEKEIDGYINRQFVLGHFKQFIPTLLSQSIQEEKARIRGEVERRYNPLTGFFIKI